jgi:hypothetical protein
MHKRVELLEQDMLLLKPKINDMYEVFDTTRNGLRMLGKIGDGVMKVSDFVEKRPKTILVLGAISAATYSSATTGKLPEWLRFIVQVFVA